MNKKSIVRTLITYLLIIGIAVYLISILSSNVTKDMNYDELLQKID